jgi:hypothetical protein
MPEQRQGAGCSRVASIDLRVTETLQLNPPQTRDRRESEPVVGGCVGVVDHPMACSEPTQPDLVVLTPVGDVLRKASYG